MNKLIILALAFLVSLQSACSLQIAGADGQQSLTPVPTVKVAVEVVTPGSSPTPVICTSLSTGVTLSAKPVSSTSLQLEMSGLQPGENLTLILRAQSDGHSVQMEAHPVQTTGPDGRFVYVVNGLSSPPGTKHWTIQIVHSRGVACTEVDLP